MKYTFDLHMSIIYYIEAYYNYMVINVVFNNGRVLGTNIKVHQQSSCCIHYDSWLWRQAPLVHQFHAMLTLQLLTSRSVVLCVHRFISLKSIRTTACCKLSSESWNALCGTPVIIMMLLLCCCSLFVWWSRVSSSVFTTYMSKHNATARAWNIPIIKTYRLTGR